MSCWGRGIYWAYDGVRYSSSLHEGWFNLTVFDVAKCDALFSANMRLESMKMS